MAGQEGLTMRVPFLPVTALLILCAAAAVVRGDFAKDQAECADQLLGLSTCLSYVDETSNAPTPDCCSGLRTVIGQGPKCLCVLIKDRNEPQLGIKINAERALSLPTICKAPVETTECISLLNLDPNSKEAEIFKQHSNTTKAAAPPTEKGTQKGGGRSGNSTLETPTPSTPKSDAVGLGGRLSRWRWGSMEIVGGIWASCSLLASLLIMSG